MDCGKDTFQMNISQLNKKEEVMNQLLVKQVKKSYGYYSWKKLTRKHMEVIGKLLEEILYMLLEI